MCITFQPRVTKVRSAPGVHRHSMQIQCRTLSSPGSRSSGIKERENLLSGHFSPFLPLFEKTRSDSKDHPNCCWWKLQITPYVKVWVDMSNLVIRLKKKQQHINGLYFHGNSSWTIPEPCSAQALKNVGLSFKNAWWNVKRRITQKWPQTDEQLKSLSLKNREEGELPQLPQMQQ